MWVENEQIDRPYVFAAKSSDPTLPWRLITSSLRIFTNQVTKLLVGRIFLKVSNKEVWYFIWSRFYQTVAKKGKRSRYTCFHKPAVAKRKDSASSHDVRRTRCYRQCIIIVWISVPSGEICRFIKYIVVIKELFIRCAAVPLFVVSISCFLFIRLKLLF